MPKAAKSRSGSNVSTETEMYDTDTILLKMTELLCDEQILKKMKTTLFPQELSDKLDHLSAQVEVLTKQLATKEQRITELEKKVATLEAQTRASLAAEARSIKKAGKIQDTWTYNGNILIKNARSDIIQVREFADLASYK